MKNMELPLNVSFVSSLIMLASMVLQKALINNNNEILYEWSSKFLSLFKNLFFISENIKVSKSNFFYIKF